MSYPSTLLRTHSDLLISDPLAAGAYHRPADKMWPTPGRSAQLCVFAGLIYVSTRFNLPSVSISSLLIFGASTVSQSANRLILKTRCILTIVRWDANSVWDPSLRIHGRFSPGSEYNG